MKLVSHNHKPWTLGRYRVWFYLMPWWRLKPELNRLLNGWHLCVGPFMLMLGWDATAPEKGSHV